MISGTELANAFNKHNKYQTLKKWLEKQYDNVSFNSIIEELIEYKLQYDFEENWNDYYYEEENAEVKNDINN